MLRASTITRVTICTATLLALMVVAAILVAYPSAADAGHRPPRILGLRTISSDFSVDETTERLQDEITARGLGIFAVVDHGANADSVGLELPPTKLILFGSPTVGTLLMQSNQTIGIDLPLKILVWEDDRGRVLIGYNTAGFLRTRHRIFDQDQVFENIAAALEGIAQGAAYDD